MPVVGSEARVRRLLKNGWVVTMDDAGSEHPDGWVLVEDGLVAEVGNGELPAADEVVDLAGAVVTPGLVNTHHHLFQTLTRARAQEADLFTWLRELYPIWARLDAEAEYAAARTGIAELALSGCTTVFDHHYVFPRGQEGLLEAEVQAASELGVRIVASRGSMDLGESKGGLPPDSVVEELDAVLADTERLATTVHDAGAGAMVQIAVAPCSPFSVTKQLMTESAEPRPAPRASAAHAPRGDGRGGRLLPRAVRLHAGRVPRGARLDGLGRLVRALRPSLRRGRRAVRAGRDRRRALPDVEPPARGRRRAGPSAPRRRCARRARRRRLGVERTVGPALRRQAGAARRARPRRPRGADLPRSASHRNTRGRRRARPHGHRLDRAWQVRRSRDLADGRARAGGAEDPVAGLVLSAPHRVDRLIVGGDDVVRDGHLVNADEAEIAREHRLQAQRLTPA